jgi:hypothetical protein
VKLLFLSLACVAFAGDNTVMLKSTCAGCHQKQVSSHGATGMAKALEPAARGEILKAHAKLTFEQGPYKYLIERKGDQSIYHVSDGKREISANLGWAFGLGAAGQTYVLERNGVWYESRVSYYKDTDGLGLTVGAQPSVPGSLEEAVGRELSTKGANECFGCHSTGAMVNGALQTATMTPGIQCQRCHEKADDHAASFQRAGAKTIPARLGALSAEETSDFCGQCHRTWSQIASDGPHNVTNVRFQPYRMTNSKCYDSSDNRIRCTACHDVHTELTHVAASYDAKCQACHSPGGKVGAKLCTVAKANCTTCHMPKVELREAHNKFTDHWIRIAKPGAPFPN